MGLKKEVPNANDDNPVCMRKGDSVKEKIITSALAKKLPRKEREILGNEDRGFWSSDKENHRNG